jgi:hypothetical protein
MIGCSLADATAIDLLPTGIHSLKRIAFWGGSRWTVYLRSSVTLNGAISGVGLAIDRRSLAIQAGVVWSVYSLRCVTTEVYVSSCGSGWGVAVIGREAFARGIVAVGDAATMIRVVSPGVVVAAIDGIAVDPIEVINVNVDVAVVPVKATENRSCRRNAHPPG